MTSLLKRKERKELRKEGTIQRMRRAGQKIFVRFTIDPSQSGLTDRSKPQCTVAQNHDSWLNAICMNLED